MHRRHLTKKDPTRNNQLLQQRNETHLEFLEVNDSYSEMNKNTDKTTLKNCTEVGTVVFYLGVELFKNLWC